MTTFRERTKSLLQGFIRFTPMNPPQREGSYFYPVYGGAHTFDDLQLLKDYQQIPEVSAIVNMKARAFSKMQIRQVSKTTGEDQKKYEDNIKVLRSPNYFQSLNEFMMQTKTFRELFGNEYIYLNYPYGFSPLSSKAMFTLPPNLMTTKTPDKRPFYMTLEPDIEYEFLWGSDKYPINKEALIHLNSNRVEMMPKNWVEGESWLSYQRAVINNIRSAYEARGFLIENRGAMGILTNAGKDQAGTIPMDQKEKDDLRTKLSTYTHEKNKVPWILTSLALNWKQISIDDPSKLGLFEEVKTDFYKLCDAAGTPPELFGSDKGTTFENQKWAERRLYENTIIPEAEEWIGALNAAFETDKRSWSIIGSFQHLNIFQENLKERGYALNLLSQGLHNMYSDTAISLQDYQNELRRAGLVIGTPGLQTTMPT